MTSVVILFSPLSQTDPSRLCTVYCAGAANKSAEPISPNYTLVKFWLCSVEKLVSESVYQAVSCGFHLLEYIIWWGTSGVAGKCLGLTGQPVAEQAANQNQGPVSQGPKTTALFLWIWWQKRLCVGVFVQQFIHVFLHTCRHTPFSLVFYIHIADFGRWLLSFTVLSASTSV